MTTEKISKFAKRPRRIMPIDIELEEMSRVGELLSNAIRADLEKKTKKTFGKAVLGIYPTRNEIDRSYKLSVIPYPDEGNGHESLEREKSRKSVMSEFLTHIKIPTEYIGKATRNDVFGLAIVAPTLQELVFIINFALSPESRITEEEFKAKNNHQPAR